MIKSPKSFWKHYPHSITSFELYFSLEYTGQLLYFTVKHGKLNLINLKQQIQGPRVNKGNKSELEQTFLLMVSQKQAPKWKSIIMAKNTNSLIQRKEIYSFNKYLLNTYTVQSQYTRCWRYKNENLLSKGS